MQIRNSWPRALAMMVIATVSPYAAPGSDTTTLSQQQLADCEAVFQQHQQATRDDKAFALESLQYARQAEANKRWGAAFKAYGDASAVAPTIDSLVGLAVSAANIRRGRSACSDEVREKINDLSIALRYLEVALFLHERVAAPPPRALNEIGRRYQEVLDAHRSVLEKQSRCTPLASPNK